MSVFSAFLVGAQHVMTSAPNSSSAGRATPSIADEALLKLACELADVDIAVLYGLVED